MNNRGEKPRQVLLEKLDPMTILTIHRPDALNAFNRSTLDEFGETLSLFERDPSQKVAIIIGAGEKAFCVGADIKDIEVMGHEEMMDWCIVGSRIFNQIAKIPKPVIAAVNGYALGGGCELALACDFRIASSDAIFGQPESTLGWIPGWGGSKRLAQLIGIARAKEMLMLGNRINAEEALKIGLVNQVVPKSSLLEKAKEWAHNLASRNPISLAAIKVMLADYGGAIKEEAHLLEALAVNFLSKSEYGRQKIKEFEEKTHKRR